jgi:hypothetical protein
MNASIEEIKAIQDRGQALVIWGTSMADPLVKAAGLQWLHELEQGSVIPESWAWNPCLMPAPDPDWYLGKELVLAAGMVEWIRLQLMTMDKDQIDQIKWRAEMYDRASSGRL